MKNTHPKNPNFRIELVQWMRVGNSIRLICVKDGIFKKKSVQEVQFYGLTRGPHSLVPLKYIDRACPLYTEDSKNNSVIGFCFSDIVYHEHSEHKPRGYTTFFMLNSTEHEISTKFKILDNTTVS